MKSKDKKKLRRALLEDGNEGFEVPAEVRAKEKTASSGFARGVTEEDRKRHEDIFGSLGSADDQEVIDLFGDFRDTFIEYPDPEEPEELPKEDYDPEEPAPEELSAAAYVREEPDEPEDILPENEAEQKKEPVNIFSILDEAPDPEEEQQDEGFEPGYAGETFAEFEHYEDYPSPEHEDIPEYDNTPEDIEGDDFEPAEDEAAERRRMMIEHTSNITLTAAEIAARKKAHAEERAKAKNKGKKKPEPEKAEKPKKTKPEKTKPAPDPMEDTVDMEDFRRDRNKLKNRKRLKRLIILLIIAGIAAGVYFTRNLWIPKLEGILDKKHETIVNDGTEQAGNFPLNTGNASVKQITSLDGSLVTVDGSHITTYEANGKLRETVYHSYGSPVVRSVGKRMLCFNFGGAGFRLYGKSGQVFEKQIEGTVLLGDLAANGNVLIVWEDSRYNVTVSVYDKNGADLYKWTNGDRISDAAFTADGTGLIVAGFGAKDGKLTSVIHRIDMTKSNAVLDSEPIEGIILKAAEASEGSIWVMCEDGLRMLSETGSLLGEYKFKLAPESFELSQSCAVAAVNEIGGGTSVYIFDGTDKALTPHTITAENDRIKKVHCFDGMAFVLGSKKLDAYASDGSLISTSEVSDDHSDFVYCENAAYFIDRQEISKVIFKT